MWHNFKTTIIYLLFIFELFIIKFYFINIHNKLNKNSNYEHIIFNIYKSQNKIAEKYIKMHKKYYNFITMSDINNFKNSQINEDLSTERVSYLYDVVSDK